MKKNKILLVDDEIDLIGPLKRNLEAVGFEVVTANGGRAAFELFKQDKIDVVVTDIRMPEGDGIELLINIKKLDIKVPVVTFITGYSDITIEQAYGMGVEATFTKPFDLDQLVDSIYWSLIPEEKKWAIVPQHEVTYQLKSDQSTSMGRGGFTAKVNHDDLICLPRIGDLLRFEVSCSLYQAPLNGYGFVRWIRKASQEVGVEISYLEENCRLEVINCSRRLRLAEYIPEFA